MILKMFTVYDSKAEAYLPPFFMRSNGEAVRSFIQASNDQSSNFCKFPGDFTLFKVGEYDDQTCSIHVLQAIENLGCAIDFKDHPNLPLNNSRVADDRALAAEENRLTSSNGEI